MWLFILRIVTYKNSTDALKDQRLYRHATMTVTCILSIGTLNNSTDRLLYIFNLMYINELL